MRPQDQPANDLPPCLTPHQNSVTLAVKVQPRTPRNAFAGILGHELRITLNAPPVDNAANEMLVRFLAEQFHCPRARIEILHGLTSRHKLVRITGVPLDRIIGTLRDAKVCPRQSR